jgi:geranyl-CoA carboxylase alpha subunit
VNRFGRVLVANRGEIAVRILRTVRSMGLESVAVYSDADADALHVRMADLAVRLGPAPSAASYLDIDRIIDAARVSAADAVHPGYGFLSENARFAEACARAGVTFIGPSPEAIRVMGSKAESKRYMLPSGVPCVPGYQGEDQSDETFVAAADRIGFPIMVKASAGGGGRGMRIVTCRSELVAALDSARSEAASAFGSGELILERALVRPRHVEFQVFGDRFGTVIHLGERDCSIQRRHQKIVEEAPCFGLSDDLRERMGAAALAAARSVNYVGAGTVEFLLDGDGEFYFLEMNTRLQVEHPVTELVTGLDLVEWQIRVAQGEPLGIAQQDVQFHGHAVEVRLCAEDPDRDFMPDSGRLEVWVAPGGEDLRVDHGLLEGQEVTPYYDPMLAKIIAWGPDRSTAIARVSRALRETHILGLATNRDYLIDVLNHPDYRSGAVSTAFLAESLRRESPGAERELEFAAVAAALLYRKGTMKALAGSLLTHARLLGWHSTSRLVTPMRIAGSEVMELQVSSTDADTLKVVHPGGTVAIRILCLEGGSVTMTLGETRTTAYYAVTEAGNIEVDMRGMRMAFKVVDDAASLSAEVRTGDVAAPMHGKIVHVEVAPGDAVEQGDVLVVMEAMKMQLSLRAPSSGTIAYLECEEGAQVAMGTVLVRVEE